MQDNMLRSLKNFLDMMIVEKSSSNNTITSYKNDIIDLFAFLKKNNITLTLISYKEIDLYVMHLYKLNLTNATIARKISAIRTFFAFLLSDGMIDNNPTIELLLPKKKYSFPKTLSRNHIAKLIQGAHYDQTPDGIRNLTIVEILYSTGIKVSELITISMEEIVYSIQSRDHTLIVCNSSRKERVVILNESAVLAVKNYLKVRNIFIHKMFYKKNFYKEKWLFHSLNKKGVVTHISRQRVGQILKKLATHNGISANIISPNRLRDSFAGHMLHNGADIRTLQELLGHTHMSSTKIYKKVVNQ